MIFRLIAVLLVIAVAGWLTCRRFRVAFRMTSPSGKLGAGDYFSWLAERARRYSRPEGRERTMFFLRTRVGIYPETWARWAFLGLVSSFTYLAASGFGFAVFTRRGMYGIPLLLHVAAGGVFAVSLAVFLFFRAREHEGIFESPGREKVRTWDSILFWVFIMAGLTLTVTALGSMLPYFSLSTQVVLIDVHRYSALVSLLAAIISIDREIPPAKR